MVVSDWDCVFHFFARFDALLEGQVVGVRDPADVVSVLHPLSTEVGRCPTVDRVTWGKQTQVDIRAFISCAIAEWSDKGFEFLTRQVGRLKLIV